MIALCGYSNENDEAQMRGYMGNSQLVSKSFVSVLAAAFSLAQAQVSRATLDQQLESQYTLTTPLADYSDFSITGSVLTLQKNGFSAGLVSNQVPTTSIYKNGQIKADNVGVASSAAKRACGMIKLPGCDRAQSAVPSRDFVRGERLYVTRIAVDWNKDIVVFDLISDFYPGAGRYKGSLKFQFPGGSVASADLAQLQPTIAEVFSVQYSVSTLQPQAATQMQPMPPPQQAQYPAQARQEQPEAPLPPLDIPVAPPSDKPAPVVETKVIDVGQTKEQVTAILGKPINVSVYSGNKEIYSYNNVNVTFVNGKVTDAE
jgi:hypothetical protein